jgi:hypothetical protein
MDPAMAGFSLIQGNFILVSLKRGRGVLVEGLFLSGEVKLID